MKKHLTYLVLYIFSALVTTASFTFAYLSTTSPSNYAGGNGNFGLVGFLLFSPIIIIFIAMSISYLHQYLYKHYEKSKIRLMTISSLMAYKDKKHLFPTK